MELTLVRDTGEVVCMRCRIADNPVARVKGFLGRSKLDDDEGMLLATWAIHTSFMRFPIDVVFLDRSFGVVKTVERLKPWRVAAFWQAHAVVELAPGAVANAALEVGEQVSLVRHGDSTSAKDNGRDDERDHALRVVIASADSRFVRVARFLLARHRFDVETCTDPAALARNPADGPADVVVLDSSASLAVTARVVRDIALASPATGFVVVGESSTVRKRVGSASQTLTVLPKWDSFDRLVSEILVVSGKGVHQ